MKYKNIREDELMNRIVTGFFSSDDCDYILNNIDFAVKKQNPAIVRHDLSCLYISGLYITKS
jgi:hypothetical protein